MIRVFIGFDSEERGAFYVLAHSIQSRSSMPVSVTPVSLSSLRGILTRERHPLQSTEFSFSRFMVPWMCNYEGWAVFMDSDMVCQDDIAKLWALRDEKFSLKVVKHNHLPKGETKFLKRTQTKYQRKNWSSVMLMNCQKLTVLTPEFVNLSDGLTLHQFKFLKDEEIGDLPNYWNHLVGHDQPKDASLVHFTEGGPWVKGYENCDFHQEWNKEKSLMIYNKEE